MDIHNGVWDTQMTGKCSSTFASSTQFNDNEITSTNYVNIGIQETIMEDGVVVHDNT